MKSTPRAGMMLVLSAIALTSACTVAPTRAGYLSTYDALGTEKGFRGKRMATPRAANLPKDAPLVIEPLAYAAGATGETELTDRDRALLLNQFGRALCTELSKPFAIAHVDSAGAYRLRAAITEAHPTGRLSATASTAVSFGLPFGFRLPIGLGRFAAEMEVIAPDGHQVAGMVWKQSADVASGSPRISRIGDAYDFAEIAAADFGDLFRKQTAGASIARFLGLESGDRDKACKVYGEENGVLRLVGGLVGISTPPELSDRPNGRNGSSRQ